MHDGSRPRPSLSPGHVTQLELISRLLFFTNPFEPAWDEQCWALWQPGPPPPMQPDDHDAKRLVREPGRFVHLIRHNLGRSVKETGEALRAGAPASDQERTAYLGAALFVLWLDFGEHFQKLIDKKGVDAPFYVYFLHRVQHDLVPAGIPLPDPPHLFAVLYQAWRAWYFAATKIRGVSPSAFAARSAIWRANLGIDLHAYAHKLYLRVDKIPVLITGETGTGKELAAECVGWSRYIPFDPATMRFATPYDGDFHARNLCEVPMDLVESALFGHKRGAFTGAIADVLGYLSLPGPNGTLFLDEIGELPPHVQAKLLRPLQSREILPIGQPRPLPAEGRIVTATNRNLEAYCHEGKFRLDLFERLNGVRIHMPSLRTMLAEMPGDLRGPTWPTSWARRCCPIP